jgi:hypothetical protein
MIRRVVAVEYICRMQGGSQPHLLRCSDGEYYVVKFQNNPQGKRTLANELLAGILASRLGLPTTKTAIVEVSDLLIDHTEELVVHLGRGRVACRSGPCFGSRLPSEVGTYGIRVPMTLHRFLPDFPPRNVANKVDFAGMLVFDKWTCNNDYRQVVFSHAKDAEEYAAVMIDNGFCFNGNEWNFPFAPKGGLCPRPSAYESVRGIDSFEPWLRVLEDDTGAQFLDQLAGEVPPEWYDYDKDALHQLLDELSRRRHQLRGLLFTARAATPQAFPNWVLKTPLMRCQPRPSASSRAKAKSA